MTEYDYQLIAQSLKGMTTEQRTAFVCRIMDDCCLHPCQILSCLGMDKNLFQALEEKVRSFLEMPAFLYERLEQIPTSKIRQYANDFVIENQ